jgi:hypothetical protein
MILFVDLRAKSDLYYIKWVFYITETKTVYCEVRNSSLYKADYFSTLEG